MGGIPVKCREVRERANVGIDEPILMDTFPLKIKRAYVQAQDGIPADESFFKAWDGFRKRRIPCELFDSEQIIRGVLPLAQDTLVAGGLRVGEAALSAIPCLPRLYRLRQTCARRSVCRSGCRGRRVDEVSPGYQPNRVVDASALSDRSKFHSSTFARLSIRPTRMRGHGARFRMTTVAWMGILCR
jgi:hypothetical protein